MTEAHTMLQKTRRWFGRIFKWLLIIALPAIITISMTLYPDWNPFAVARIKIWLTDNPKWVLLVSGSVICGWWYTVVACYLRHDKHTSEHRKAIQRIEGERAAALEKLSSEHFNRVEKLEAEQRVVLGDLATKHTSTVERLESERASAIENVQAQHRSEMSRREAEHSSQTAALESHLNELQAELALPDSEDQKRFDIVLKVLSDSTGLFGWLMSGRFSGRQWRTSDVNYIHELLGPPYQKLEFRDAYVHEAYAHLQDTLRGFIGELGNHIGEQKDLPGGDVQTFIRDNGTTEADKVAEQLSRLADDIIDARSSFLDSGRAAKLSDIVLVDPTI